MAKSSVNKELTPDEWFDEIDHAFKYRHKFGIEQKWSKLEALFYNVDDSNVHQGPNLIASTGDALLSTLSVPAPRIGVNAKRREFLQSARILESLDNSLLREMKLRQEVETAMLHAFLWSRGILKIGYDSEFGFDPSQDLGGEDNPLGMTLSQFKKDGRRIEYDSDVKPGTPWIRAVLPHDFLVPWGTRCIEDAPWVAHRIIRHIDDIKADVKYSHKKNLQPALSMEDFSRSYRSSSRPTKVSHAMTVMDRNFNDAEYVEMFEIHDKRWQKVYVIAVGHDKFLRNEQNLLQLNGLPFVSFSFTPVARAFWGTSDAYYLLQNQAELTDISLHAMKQRRLATLKLLYAKGAIEENELTKVLTGSVGAGVGVNEGYELDKAVKTFTPGNLNVLLYQDAEQVRRDARETVGFSRNQVGEFESTGRRTATEANIVQQGSQVRISRRELVMKTVYTQLIEKINSVIFEFWTTPKYTNILGEQGVKEWLAFKGPELRGNYDYEVTFSPADELSPVARRQMLMQLMQQLANDPLADQGELRRLLLAGFNNPELSQLYAQLQEQNQGDQNAGVSSSVSGVQSQRGPGAQNGPAGPGAGVSSVQR